MAGRKRRRPVVRQKKIATLEASKLKLIATILVVLSMVIMSVSTLMPWGKLSAKTSFAGIDVDINADAYVYKVNYKASGEGRISLTGTPINITMEDEKVFLTGLNDFQETIGFIKGSQKDYFYTINYYDTITDDEVTLNVWTHADMIPWWPVGVPQTVKTKVEVVSMDPNIDHVTVRSMRIEMLPGDGNLEDYTPAKLASKAVDEQLTAAGDEVVNEFSVTLNDDHGYIRVYATAELEVTAKSGGGSFKAQEGYSRNKGPGGITLWTVSQDKTVRLGMMLGSFPILVMGVGFGAIAILMTFRRPRFMRGTALTAMALMLMATLFYMAGVSALIELTGYYDWFSWTPGIGMPWAAAFMMMAATGLLFMIPRPSSKTRTKKVTLKDTQAPRRRRRRPA